MTTSQRFLNPSEAARRLGVSTKALRLYEQHGLIKPIRTARWLADLWLCCVRTRCGDRGPARTRP